MRLSNRLSTWLLLLCFLALAGASGRAASDAAGRIVFSDPLIQSIYKDIYNPAGGVGVSPWGIFGLWNPGAAGSDPFFEWLPAQMVEGSNWLEWRWRGSDVPAGFSELWPGQLAEQIDEMVETHLKSFGEDIIEIIKPRPSFQSALKPPVNLRASQREFGHKIELTWENPNPSMPAGWGFSVYVGLTPHKENATRYHNIAFVNPLPVASPRESFSYPLQHPYTSLAPRLYFWVAYTHEGLEFVSENPEVWGAFRGAPLTPAMVWRAWPVVTRFHASLPRDSAGGGSGLIVTNQPPAITIEQGVPLRYALPSYATLPGEIISTPAADALLPAGVHQITIRLQPAVIGYSALEVSRTVRVEPPGEPPAVLLKNLSPSAAEGIELTVEGLAGLPLQLESSPDLKTWTKIGGIIHLPDTAAETRVQAPQGPAHLFYRVVAP